MSGKVAVISVAALAWVAQVSAAASPWSGRYTVRTGDSLTAIAADYGVSLTALADGNGLNWRKPLLIGVVLRVPSRANPTNVAGPIYLVRPGDTLSRIALGYHISLAQLASANAINPSGVLLIGARLRIPTAGASTLDLAHLVESDPYQHGAVGYDASYPSCAARVSPSYGFAVIGLNWGRPFTTNPCFASEWASAQPPRSVYINTAYSRTLFRHLTPACLAAGSRQLLGLAAQRAYAVGCNEAVTTLRLLNTFAPLAIWLDVEPANTWSSLRSLNAATIRGILDYLLTHSRARIGIYSRADYWRAIAGDWSSLSVPEWVASGAPDPPGCPLGFAAGPVWLSQSSDGQRDTDTVC